MNNPVYIPKDSHKDLFTEDNGTKVHPATRDAMAAYVVGRMKKKPE